MPRGRGKSYKGRSRHFTSEDELARQTKDVKNWRRRADDDEDDDETVKKGSDEEDSEEEEDTAKATSVSKLIEVENPNRVADKSHKVDALDVEAKPELTRREREAIEKEQAKLRYQKLQAEGKTDEARADLARLAIIKKQREEAAKKKADEKKDKDKQAAAAAAAEREAQEARMTAGSSKAARKKRK